MARRKIKFSAWPAEVAVPITLFWWNCKDQREEEGEGDGVGEGRE